MNSTVASVSNPSSVRLLMANMPSMLSDLLRNAFRSVDDIVISEPINDVMQLPAALNKPVDVVLLGIPQDEYDLHCIVISRASDGLRSCA